MRPLKKRGCALREAQLIRGSKLPLLHQQHLPGALDHTAQAALIMRGQTGVFARQDAALVGDERAQQIGVLEPPRSLRSDLSVCVLRGIMVT
jgi:hypothetical protein